jgi:hypothetical protein
MRVSVVRGLLLSNDAQSRAIGIRALKAMLQTGHFSSSYGFEFGSRSRDYGYHPRTGKDVRGWFDVVMEVASPLALSTSPVAREIRKCIAGEFRGLWLHAGQTDALENLGKKIAAETFWREGWIATRQTMAAAGQEMSDALGRLTALEALLRPKDLVDQVNAVVLGTNPGMIDLEETVGNESVDFNTRAEREHATLENLGKDVANHEEAFKTLLPRLVLGGFRVPVFGEGLASTDKPYEVWRALLTAFKATERAETSVIRGFLSGTQRRDPDQANRLLDEALEDPSLGPRFVELQAVVTIDEAGVRRLHRALDIGMAPISQFAALAHGSASDSIPAAAFRDLMFAISSKEGGNDVALQILSMRLFSDHSHKQPSPPEVREVGRALLASHEFHPPHGRAYQEDWELGRVAQVCLEGDDGRPIVKRIVRNMMDAINRRHIRAHDQDDLMNSLLLLHPFAVLDEMFSGDAKAQRDAVRAFADLMRFQRNPLDGVLDATLLEWCDRDPRVRYPLIASSVTLFRRPADDEPHQWTPIALQLLAKAPDPPTVFEAIAQRLHPTSWSGSLATKLESRLKLLEKLQPGGAPRLVELFNQARAALNSQIVSERKRELEEDRSRSARFE